MPAPGLAVMDEKMLEFLAALLVFLLSHAVPARSGLRRRLTERLGERTYLILYSLLSVLILAWLISAATRAPYLPLWDLALWHYHVPIASMLPAFILFAAGALSPNPFSISFSSRPFDARRPGIVGVTRHPILWGFALWAFGHVVPNGDLVSVIMFGGFGLFALLGMKAVDRRKHKALGEVWEEGTAATSILPFAALLTGRASWRWRPQDVATALLVGAAFYLALLFLHPILFGPDPAAILLG